MLHSLLLLAMMAWGASGLSQSETEWVGKLLADNKVTDSNIKNSLVIDLVLGGVLLLAFSILQRSSILYRFRLFSPSVTSPPPPLDTGGLRSIWAWMKGALVTSDLELLQSCGLDALMMVKVSALGVQLCLPLCICGLCILLPVHASGGYLSSSEANSSGFMHFTISNIQPRSKLLWLHFVLVYLYIAYGCWLLRWHYRQFLVLRQHFLRKGEDVNQWRRLYEQDSPSGGGRQSASGRVEGRLQALMSLIPVIKNLAANRVPVREDGVGQDVAPFAREAEEVGDEEAHDGVFEVGEQEGLVEDEQSSLLLSPDGTQHGAAKRRSSTSPPRTMGRVSSMPRPQHIELQRLKSASLRRNTAETVQQGGVASPVMRQLGRMHTMAPHERSALAPCVLSGAQQGPGVAGAGGGQTVGNHEGQLLPHGTEMSSNATMAQDRPQPLHYVHPHRSGFMGLQKQGRRHSVEGRLSHTAGTSNNSAQHTASLRALQPHATIQIYSPASDVLGDRRTAFGAGGGAEHSSGLLRPWHHPSLLLNTRDSSTMSDLPERRRRAAALQQLIAQELDLPRVVHEPLRANPLAYERNSHEHSYAAGEDAELSLEDVVIHSLYPGTSNPAGLQRARSMHPGAVHEGDVHGQARRSSNMEGSSRPHTLEPVSDTLHNQHSTQQAQRAKEDENTQSRPTQSELQPHSHKSLSSHFPATGTNSHAKKHPHHPSMQAMPRLQSKELPLIGDDGKGDVRGRISSVAAGSSFPNRGSITTAGPAPAARRLTAGADGADGAADAGDASVRASAGDDVLEDMPRWWGTVSVPRGAGHARHTSSAAAFGGAASSAAQVGGSSARGGKLTQHHRAASWGALMNQLDGEAHGQRSPTAIAVGSTATPFKHTKSRSRSRGGTPTRTQLTAAAADAAAPFTPMRGMSAAPVAQVSAIPVPPVIPPLTLAGMNRQVPTGVSMQAVAAEGDSGDGGEEEEGEEGGMAVGRMELLAMPSVRFRKTINTHDWRGRSVAVNAQHYAVLVTDVKQPLYGDPTDDTLYASSRAKGYLARLAPWNVASAVFGYAHHAKSEVMAAPQGIPFSPDAARRLFQVPLPWDASHPRSAAAAAHSSGPSNTAAVTSRAASHAVQLAPRNSHNQGDPRGMPSAGSTPARPKHRRLPSHGTTALLGPNAQHSDAAVHREGDTGQGIPKLVGLLEQILTMAHINNTGGQQADGGRHGPRAGRHSRGPSAGTALELQLHDGGTVSGTARVHERSSAQGRSTANPSGSKPGPVGEGVEGQRAQGQSGQHRQLYGQQAHDANHNQQASNAHDAVADPEHVLVQLPQLPPPFYLTQLSSPLPTPPASTGAGGAGANAALQQGVPHGGLPATHAHDSPSQGEWGVSGGRRGHDTPAAGEHAGSTTSPHAGQEGLGPRTATGQLSEEGCESVIIHSTPSASQASFSHLDSHRSTRSAHTSLRLSVTSASQGPGATGPFGGAGNVSPTDDTSAASCRHGRQQLAAASGRDRWITGGGKAGDSVHQDGASEQGGPSSKWDIVRDAVYSGAVADLLYSRQYSTVTATFKRLFPDDFDRAIPVIRHRQVDELLLKLDEHLGGYEQAKLYFGRRGERLYKRLGWLGMVGQRVDALEHHRDKVIELQERLVVARKAALAHGATPSWFVFFKSQAAATIAAVATLHAEDNRHFKVRPAPGPEEVNWGALWLTFRQRDLRAMLTLPLLIALILVPVGIFAGGLQQLDYLFCPTHRCYVEYETVALDTSGLHTNITYLLTNATACDLINGTVISSTNSFEWKWYCRKGDIASQALGFFVVGWLPSLLLIVWQGGILPLGLYLLIQMGGSCFSLSMLDARIASWLFHFATFNVFLGGMLGSAIVQQVNQSLEKGPAELFNLIGNSLPTSSNFFLNYLLFRALVGIPARLLIPHVGVRLFLVRRYLRCVWMLTERDKALLYAPVSPRYGFEYGMLLIVFLVALAFSVVSPMLLPLAVLFFMLSWLFWRYSLLFVYVRKYESGGLMWPWVFRRVLVCFLICALFTGCVFVVKEAYVQAFIMFATVPVVLHRFSNYCWYRYQMGVATLPLEYAHQAPRASVDPWVYIPPPLHHKAFGWWPDWAKPWGGWGMPAGTATL